MTMQILLFSSTHHSKSQYIVDLVVNTAKQSFPDASNYKCSQTKCENSFIIWICKFIFIGSVFHLDICSNRTRSFVAFTNNGGFWYEKYIVLSVNRFIPYTSPVVSLYTLKAFVIGVYNVCTAPLPITLFWARSVNSSLCTWAL